VLRYICLLFEHGIEQLLEFPVLSLTLILIYDSIVGKSAVSLDFHRERERDQVSALYLD